MSLHSSARSHQLTILHCFRAVDGGLFRHVRDVAAQQSAAGHRVGLACDIGPYSDLEEERLAALAPTLELGLHRWAIPRGIGPKDIAVVAKTADLIDRVQPDIIHGHGAKGGVMARMGGHWARHRGAARLYCPHGGSLWFDKQSLKGRLYFMAERFQERYTEALVCVAASSAATYREKIHNASVPFEVVYNGLHPHEFKPVKQCVDPADFLLIGALRDLKGVDLFIDALPRLTRADGTPANAIIVGSGEQKDHYWAQVERLGLSRRVRFYPPMPARKAFMLARINVMASRSESLPYIVLETIGAHMPLVATNVGGIPEIFGPHAPHLVAPDSVEALAGGMQRALDDPEGMAAHMAELNHHVAQSFTVQAMAQTLEQVYRRALARRLNRPRPADIAAPALPAAKSPLSD